MEPFEHGGIVTDLCEGCGGLWFDRDELERRLGAELPGVAPPRESASDRPCPACPSRLVERTVPAAGGTVLDVCRSCAGIFIDAGELHTLQRAALALRRRDEQRSGRPPLPGDASGGVADLRERLRAHGSAGSTGRGHGVIRRTTLSGSLFLLIAGVHLKEGGPTRRWPTYATYLLLVACTLVWLVMVLGSAPLEAWIDATGSVPSRLRAGDGMIRVLTSAFVHGSWAHLGCNLWFLWLLGEDVEGRVGPWGLVALFLGASAAGDLLDAFASTGADAMLPRVGASGGVSGLAGAYMILFPRTRFLIPIFRLLHELWLLALPAWIVLGGMVIANLLGISAGTPGTAWWAHLGGFAAGIAAGCVVRAVPTTPACRAQRRRSWPGARPVQRR